MRKAYHTQSRAWLPRAVVYLTSVLETLLIARLVARMLAARPDNPAFQTLYLLTDPLTRTLRMLDAHQPRFGAVIELSTLTLVLLVPVAGYILWRLSIQWGETSHG